MKKNLFSLGLMTAAVIALASCAKEAAAPVVDDLTSEGVPFEIVAGVGTKTALSPTVGDASVIDWVKGDAISLFVAEHEGEYSGNRKFSIAEEDVDANRFTGTLESALDASKTYDWKVVYPWKSGFKLVNASGSGNGTFIPFGSQTNSSQTQKGNNNLEHLAGSNMPLYGVAENVAGDETPVIEMKQAMSVVKVHVTNKANSPLTVTSVAVSAPEGTLINGTFYVDFSGVNPTYSSSGPSYTSNTANLTVTEGTAIAKNGSADFYIGVLPFTLASGAKLTVNINGADIEKTASAQTAFEAGMIKTVNVDYTGGVEYTTLAEIFATSGGEGTYNIKDLLVYAKNNNSAILGDASGVKILLYKSSHGLNVGETVDATNAVIGTYNDNIQITNGTFTVKSTGTAVDHGTPWDLDDETVVAEMPKNSAYFSPFYAKMVGEQGTGDNARLITGEAKLYLDMSNSSTVGKKVIFEGYVCSYSSTNANHRVLATKLVERMTVSPASLSWKADETDAKTITVTLNDGGAGYTVTPATDSKFTIADDENGTITVTPKGVNTSTSADNSVTLTITHKNDATVQTTVTCTQKKASSAGAKTDVLNQTWTGVTGTNYTLVEGLDGSESSAVYTVQCAGSNSSIQLRSNNNNSGIVSTTSGGKVSKIVVTWEANTADGRTINIYGSTSAYTNPTDLYDTSKQGTLLGTIVKGTSTELTVDGTYTYVGIRSASGALYMSEVKITWE